MQEMRDDRAVASPGERRTAWRVRVAVTAVVAVMATLGGVGAGAAPAAAAPVCDEGWFVVGSSLVDWYSDWFDTTPNAQNQEREIQFRVTKFFKYRYQFANCNVTPVSTFPTASMYRVRLAGQGNPPWLAYTEGNQGPGRLFRWPGLCAGWDFNRGVYWTWTC